MDYLLSIRLASGNLPSSLESSVDDRLVHWCHGASGAVHLFARAYKVCGRLQINGHMVSHSISHIFSLEGPIPTIQTYFCSLQ